MVNFNRFVLSSFFINIVNIQLAEFHSFCAYFGTKTTYRTSLWHSHSDTDSHNVHVNRRYDNKLDSNSDDSMMNVAEKHPQDKSLFEKYGTNNWPEWCTPVQVNSLIRHGIRNAGGKEITRFTDVFHRISNHLEQENKLLHTAMSKVLGVVHATKPKLLLNEGRTEQKQLSSRIFSRYSDLFHDAESSDVYFMASTSPRTVESCESFISEWQQQLNSVEFNPEIHINDSVLRFFDHCNKYIEDIENKKKSALQEYYQYVQQNFPHIAESISRRLELDDTSKIHSKEVKALYIMTALEFATLETSDMLQLFDESEVMMMEYASDLKQYWKKSYGHKINYEQSCPLLIDIIKHMDQAVDEKRYKRGVFRFAHAETMLPLQALLGLFKDEDKLRADNWQSHQDRLFKTSRISPFSGNLQFVLFKCDVTSASDGPPHEGVEWEEYMVQLLINEVPQRIPGWNQDFCTYTAFRKHLQNIVDSCDLESMCHVVQNHEEL